MFGYHPGGLAATMGLVAAMLSVAFSHGKALVLWRAADWSAPTPAPQARPRRRPHVCLRRRPAGGLVRTVGGGEYSRVSGRENSRRGGRGLTPPAAQVFNAAFVLEISPDCQVAPPLCPRYRRQHIVRM
jgi:hypothetical protein